MNERREAMQHDTYPCGVRESNADARDRLNLKGEDKRKEKGLILAYLTLTGGRGGGEGRCSAYFRKGGREKETFISTTD